MRTSNNDIFWSYSASLFRFGGSILLLPILLISLDAKSLGLFYLIAGLANIPAILDFGFNSSFSRNISYIIGGAQNLRGQGLDQSDIKNKEVNYPLLKDLLHTMKKWYTYLMIFVAFLLISLGLLYLNFILIDESNNFKINAYIALIFASLSYGLDIFTQSKDAILIGMGKVAKAKKLYSQIQILYFVSASLLLILIPNLVCIFMVQLTVSILYFISINKKLKKISFIKNSEKSFHAEGYDYSKRNIIKAISPNALKIGLTSLGGFVANKGLIYIAAGYLSLIDIAKLGLSIQFITVIAGLGRVFLTAHLPEIYNLMIVGNFKRIRLIALHADMILFSTFIILGSAILFFGSPFVEKLGDDKELIGFWALLLLIIFCYLETRHILASQVLIAANAVPFFRASLVAGVTSVTICVFLLEIWMQDVLAVVIAAGIAQLYNNFKWPLERKKLLLSGIKNNFA